MPKDLKKERGKAMKKKLISFCLAFAMILTSIAIVPVNAASGTLKASDVSKEAGLLQAIGIISEMADETEGNKEITRAEFAVTVGKALGFKTQTETVHYFTDIPDDHWSLSYVNRLTEMGILSQPADAKFRPNDKITVNEAMKILVCACGYGDYALMLGSYPGGYSEVAGKLDFSITGGSEALTVYRSYILLYDALNAPVYEKTASGAGYVAYNESEDTLLSKYFDVYDTEGVITQSTGISIYGALETGKTNSETAGIVVIDGENYTSNLDLYDYLGRRAKVYYVQADEDDTPNIIYREDYKRSDEVIDIAAEDFDEFKNGVLTYYGKNNKREKINVTTGIITVKNGDIVTKNVADAFDISKGSIRIIDIEDDGVYDVAIISEYKNIVVDRISTDSYVVYDKVNTSRFATLDEDKKVVFVEDSTGAQKSFADIKSGDVLSVYESDTYARVIIGPASVTGTVYGVKTEDDKFMLELGKSETDRTWYEVDVDYYNEYIKGKYYENSAGATVYTGDIDLSTGGTVTYYKDVAGHIAYLTGPTPNGWTVGYLVRANYNEDDDGVILKIYTQAGAMKTFQTADKVSVDGSKKRGYDEITHALDKTNYGKKLDEYEHNVNGQLLRFKTNAEGKISSIDTEYVNASAEDRLSLHRTYAAANRTWWYHTNSYWGDGSPMMFYNGSTIKLCVPTHKKLADAEDDDFSASLDLVDTRQHTVEGFKLDTKSAYEDIIVEYGASESSTTKGPFLVDKVYTTSAADGSLQTTAEVYGMESCNLTKLTAKEGYEFTHTAGRDDNGAIVTTISRGDVITVNANDKGLITGVNVYFDYSRKDDSSYAPSTGWLKGSGSHQSDTETYMLSAYIKSYDNGLLRFKYNSIDDSDLNEENYAKYDWATMNDAASVLVFDGKNISIGNSAEIVPATVTGAADAKLYWCAVRYGRVKGVVVYK